MGGTKKAMPPTFLENIVIFCFERRFSRQNSVIRLKSNILAPPKFLGWLRHWCEPLQILCFLFTLHSFATAHYFAE